MCVMTFLIRERFPFQDHSEFRACLATAQLLASLNQRAKLGRTGQLPEASFPDLRRVVVQKLGASVSWIPEIAEAGV